MIPRGYGLGQDQIDLVSAVNRAGDTLNQRLVELIMINNFAILYMTGL